MQDIEAKQGQSFFDIVIVGTGDITNAFKMALANNTSVTNGPVTGEVFVLAGTERKAITGVFGKTHYPATATIVGSSQEGADYLLPQILPMSL